MTSDDATRRNLTTPTWYAFTALTEDDIVDFAAGLVPHHVRADARALLDFDDLARRNADRPVRQSRRGRNATVR